MKVGFTTGNISPDFVTNKAPMIPGKLWHIVCSYDYPLSYQRHSTLPILERSKAQLPSVKTPQSHTSRPP
jgi:hypothetical protein